MFIELHSPEIIDRVADVSSVGVRIGEGWSREYGPRGPWGKYWLSLKFKNQWDWFLILLILVVGCLCIYTAIVFATK
jgi:hypothetical protein